MHWRMSRAGMEKLGIREDIPQEQDGRDQGRGEVSWVREHVTALKGSQAGGAAWKRVLQDKAGTGQEAEEGMSAHLRHLWGHNWEIGIWFQGQYEDTGKFLAEVLYWFSFSYTRNRRCVSCGSNREAKNNHWVCWSGPGNKWQPGPGWKSQRRKAVDGLCLHFNQHQWIIGEHSKWTPVQIQTVPSG